MTGWHLFWAVYLTLAAVIFLGMVAYDLVRNWGESALFCFEAGLFVLLYILAMSFFWFVLVPIQFAVPGSDWSLSSGRQAAQPERNSWRSMA
jgi:hypothetical protein